MPAGAPVSSQSTLGGLAFSNENRVSPPIQKSRCERRYSCFTLYFAELERATGLAQNKERRKGENLYCFGNCILRFPINFLLTAWMRWFKHRVRPTRQTYNTGRTTGSAKRTEVAAERGNEVECWKDGDAQRNDGDASIAPGTNALARLS